MTNPTGFLRRRLEFHALHLYFENLLQVYYDVLCLSSKTLKYTAGLRIAPLRPGHDAMIVVRHNVL